MIKLIIFDLDDTLVDTSDLYWQVRNSFIQFISNEINTKQEFVKIFEEIDTQNTKIHGYHPKRYEFTMLEMCGTLRLNFNEEQLNIVRSIARRILTDVPEAISGAWDLLQWAQERYILYLMTRGIEEVQSKKIDKYHLKNYFKAIEIVDKKDESRFRNLINKAGVLPSETVIIGDSVKAEINPALKIGAYAIHYQYAHHTYKWLQEHIDKPVNENYYKATKLSEIKEILGKLA